MRQDFYDGKRDLHKSFRIQFRFFTEVPGVGADSSKAEATRLPMFRQIESGRTRVKIR